MATQEQYRELARQLTATVAIQRDLGRTLPADCPPASAIVLMVLNRHGEMRMSRLAELLSIDISVTSRHAAHVTERGWIDRQPDPLDGRSRLLRINDRGLALLDEVADRYTEVLAHCLSGWSEEDIGQLNTLLARLRESFGDCRTRPGSPTAAATAPTERAEQAGPVGRTEPTGAAGPTEPAATPVPPAAAVPPAPAAPAEPPVPPAPPVPAVPQPPPPSAADLDPTRTPAKQ